ncbi:uncharacterized protein PAC_11658 [Phialocephala subalpina]|uniref:Apple domain-containing protein n=1 Tax=Phialocephala subalpina TaxID=576137 RepID=A0A1L7X9R0_9HELO|nr:uncharacterized protein PAC_11658 [Phialocephala subalpina]
MHSFTATILAASALFSAASAGPIFARQVCGAAPAGTTAQTPLTQPSGISTAADCATQCKANPSCQSFLFGLSGGTDKCMLFSVPASSVPAQTGLVAYDISCSSFPSVVPTSANPGGLATSNSGAAGNNGAQPRRRQQQGGAASGNTGANSNGGAAASNAGATNNNGGAATANQGTHGQPHERRPSRKSQPHLHSRS